MKHPFQWWRECEIASRSRRIDPKTFEPTVTHKSVAYASLLDLASSMGYKDSPKELLEVVKVERSTTGNSHLLDEFEVTALREQEYVLEYEKFINKEE